jgi:hypothetical protein
LGDKLQVLALVRPRVLRILEGVVDRLLLNALDDRGESS